MRNSLMCCLLLMLFVCSAFAQTETGAVHGTVTTTDGRVIGEVRVTLSGANFPKAEIATNNRGYYIFENLPAGTFTLAFAKNGFKTLTHENVDVKQGKMSRLNVALEISASEHVVTLFRETASVDLKKTGISTQLTQEYLANIPSARDPWVIIDQVAGLNVDRVNVGGSESGKQSVVTSKGADMSSTMWRINGVTITDTGAIGSSPLYYDFDSFEEMQVTTSGADVSVQTAGASLNFITKQGSDVFHGQGSYYYTGDSLQDSNLTPELKKLGYQGNKIESLEDYGFDVGGPALKGNLWFWGAYRVQDIGLVAVTGAPDTTDLEHVNIKLTGQAGDRNRWTFYYTRADKIKHSRGAAWNRPQETTLHQRSPSSVYMFEDTFIANENFFIIGQFSYVDGGFTLEPNGGRDAIATLDYGTGMFGGTTWYYETKRPQFQVHIRGEQYIQQAFGGSHEIKAAMEWRRTPVTSLSGYGQDMLQATWLGEPIEVWLMGKSDTRTVSKRFSLYAQDIWSLNRWTLYLGVRYDRQWGQNVASTSAGNSIIPDLIPDLSYRGDSPQFHWNDVLPRLGLTHDLFGDGRTVLRANFSMYCDQLGNSIISNTNPISWREIDFAWSDDNGDGVPQAKELGDILWWTGLNPFDSENPIDNGRRIDSDLQSPLTYEFLIGGEREINPQLSISLDYIYRSFTNFNWEPDDAWIDDPYTLVGTVSQSGYTEEYYEPTVDPAGTSTLTLRNDYSRTYKGIELTLTKRLSNHWMANASFSYGNTTVNYITNRAFTDPTNIKYLDGYAYAPETTGSGKSEVFMNSRWAFKFTAMMQLPYGINVSSYASYREGFVYPVQLRSRLRNHYAGYAYPLVEGMGESHLPNVPMVDLRIEKSFRLQSLGRASLIMDIFNLFNFNTTLGRNFRAYQSTFGQITEIMNPRIVRLGVRFQF